MGIQSKASEQKKNEYWTYIVGLLKNIARGLKIPHSISSRIYKAMVTKKLKSYRKEWLVKNGNESYFEINGAKLPDVSNDKNQIVSLMSAFEDVFLVPYYYNDNHDKSVVEAVDKFMIEGPYGYSDGNFDVTVKSGDIVIDAGAWIGDFSAYAASKGAVSYAFEPVNDTFNLLCKTAELNDNKIYPIRKGLSDTNKETTIKVSQTNSGESSLILDSGKGENQTILLTTLDHFAEENNLERIDFIKADIEGAERDMLKGATHVLRTFAPKLAICTYHLPDDPEVLENIILEANPNYKVVQLRHKLFAAVVNNSKKKQE